MKILITGANGFAGSHLAELLLKNPEIELYGSVRWKSDLSNLVNIKSKIKLVEVDIRDANSVRNMIKEVNPEQIYHLAAMSYVPASWHTPLETFETNVNGTINILEAARSLHDCRILIAGSSEEYGLVHEDELPIKETNPLRPLSPYAVSKVAADMLGIQYHHSYKMDIIVTRAFNHEGPRRPSNFVISGFCYQIAKQLKRGLTDFKLLVGDTTTIRDFSDVRDVVWVYSSIMMVGETGEVYNICPGIGFKILDVIKMIEEIVGVSIKTIRDESRIRPSDVPILIGDSTKLRTVIGANYYKIPLKETISDMLEYWRTRI